MIERKEFGINAYRVEKCSGTPVVEFVSEDQSSRTAALDTARGVAKAFTCCIFVFNSKSHFMWVAFKDGIVQSVGVPKKGNRHG